MEGDNFWERDNIRRWVNTRDYWGKMKFVGFKRLLKARAG